MIKIQCEQCGKDVYVFPSRIGRSKYCSKKCLWKNIASKFIVPKLELKCVSCNKTFFRLKSKTLHGRGKYCSKQCEYIGKLAEGNPHWVGDKITKGGGRQRARRNFKNSMPCIVCGKLKTDRHHVNGNTADNTKENIMWLCRRHHQEKDGRIKNGKLYLNSNYK